MRVGDVIELECPVRVEADFLSAIVAAARGKSVLNVGAAGNAFYYLPDRRDEWMHLHLKAAAAEIVGIDIDREGIAHAASHGVELVEANAETADFGRLFDLVVMAEVLEHVERPPLALVNLVRQLRPGGELWVTTPNPTSLGTVLRTLRRRPVSVYWDHVTAFFPENIQAICDRHGLTLDRVAYFTPSDHRTATLTTKSRILQTVGRVNPKLHSNFLAVIRA